MFSEIINPFLNVRNKIKDSQGNWVDEQRPVETQHFVQESRAPVGGSTEINIFDKWDKRIILDNLAMGSDTTVYPILISEEEELGLNRNIFRAMTTSGGTSGAWASVISAQGHHLLEIGSSDNDGATIFLKRPIVLPKGGKLSFLGSSSASGEMSYMASWREIEE